MQQKLIINRLSSVFCHLSSVICRLSSILCPLLSVICLLSSVLGTSTSVEDPLQISSFYAKQTQFSESQMNVNPYNTMNYENKSNWTLGENKPNQTQSCPP